MHELAITQDMFDIVMKQAAEATAQKVTRVKLVIGEMTGVVADSVQFYFDLLSKGTIAEGATINIKPVPAKVKCRTCGRESELKPFDFTCPHCGGTSLEVVAGNELVVESIEVE